MFTTLTDETYAETISNTTSGVLICFKKNCPHCKNMEKVVEKFSKKNPDVALFNLDSEENAQATAQLGSERAPTLFVIKSGVIAARKAGLMNPKEMKAFFASA